MKNPQVIFLIIIVAIGLVMGGFLLNPASSPSTKTDTKQTQSDPSLINNSSAPLIGRSDAKAKIVVFSDYECPYCKNAHDIVDNLLKKYPDDVSVVYRNFIVHPTSEIFARAAEAANKQGEFKEMSDEIFADTSNPTEDRVKELASKLKLDKDKFASDLNSEEIKNRISKDDEDARGLGLQGTPSIFLNNESVDNFNSLEATVSQKLGK